MSLQARNKWEAKGVEMATPTSTHLFVQRDSALYLDFYKAADGSVREIDGKKKPAVIFAFGGGFMGGQRDKTHYQQWIKLLNDNGYPVFSIDYRLGLKGVSVKGVKMIKAIRHSIEIGVEDMFAATSFIIDNADKFGIEPDNLVISGSSAGAIISLQSEYELCNHSKLASVLPDGFKYAGVISFSGAIFSTHGRVKYADAPAPQLLLHGTADRVVTYKSIRVFNLGLFGSSKISRQLDVSMGSMMGMVNGFAIVIYMVLIYLLSKIIIEKNAQSISMVKILGYTNGEISKLYIMSTSLVVVFCLLLSLPLETVIMKVLFREMMLSSISGWITLWIDPMIYVQMFAAGIITYGIVALLEFRRVKKVPMDEALKNVE